jgi:hypothetical protein
MKYFKPIWLLFLLGIMTECDLQNKEKIHVLPAHAHNDYENTRPLLDALECKFISIEVDVFSIGDSLFVAHYPNQIETGKTLRKMYLNPLKEIILKNNGSVYGEGTSLMLLVDIKDDGLRTYRILHRILESYKEMLTSYKSGIKNMGPIAVIVSGNRPFEYMRNQQLRYAAYDGRIADMNLGISSSLMPLVSDNWRNHFKWNGLGEMPESEKNKLSQLVQNAHKNGYLLRFWGTTDNPGIERNAVWNCLKEARVDLIGTDDLIGLQAQFLKE